MDSAPVLKRPKPTDREEELFRMQEEFLKNKQQPSAKVINLRGSSKFQNSSTSSKASENQSNTRKIKSRFSELKRLKTQDEVSTSQASGDVINPTVKEDIQKNFECSLHDSVQNIPIAPSNIILGNIIEKKYDSNNYKFNGNETLHNTNKGFPEVFVSTHKKNDGNQSLFSQQVASKEFLADKTKGSRTSEPSANDGGSFIVQGSWATEIHKENVERLNQMSQEDILREKNKLEMALNPELIQFVKDRRNRKQKVKEKEELSICSKDQHDTPMDEEKLGTEETSNRHDENSSKNNEITLMQVDEPKVSDKSINDDTALMQVDEPEICVKNSEDSLKALGASMQVDETEESVPKPSIELMEQARAKGWVHMNSLEPEKLKWMEDISEEKKDEPAPNEPYNARFDFSGLLLPYKDENIPIEKGLHHHGEEPERPGYSLQELLQLSRSATQQQRCTALTTLANIMEKSRKGWYDKVLQPAPLATLSERNLLLLLRFSLDDTSVAVVTATLQALHAFLYSEADEICLDRLYGFQNYKEPVLATPKTDVPDTNSLKDHELAQLDAVAALLRTDILLRIRYILSELRPSPIGVTCALEILIRLMRHSPITALNISSTPNLLETVIENFMPLSANRLATQDSINNVYGVPVLAAVRFCRVLLCYAGKPVARKLDRLKIVQRIISYVTCDAGQRSFNLSIESLRLWRTLLFHGEAKDSLTGAQIILVSQLQLLLSNHHIWEASELSCEYAAALIAVAGCLPSLKANISVLLCKWSTQLLSLSNVSWGKTKLIAETLLAVSDNVSAIETLTISQSRVFSGLESTSNLLSCQSMDTEREPPCLPHLGVLVQDDQLQPIVSQESCFPFLATVLNVYVKHSFVKEIQALFNIPQLCKYLTKLETADWSLERSWYSRSELFFLVAIVNAAFIIRDKLDNKTAHIIWKVAIKLVSSLPADSASDVKSMLRIALSEEKLNLAVVASELEKLNLNSNIDNIKLNLSRNVASLYERYVALNGEWDQAAMPRDWLYLPVVHIYTKCRNSGACNDEDKSTILTVLSLELLLPDLVEKLSQSLRFSRLVLVYLCDTVYLDADVSALLARATSTLFKNYYNTLNFTVDLPGLTSFTDLFTAMCEHFCSSSYGDYGFSMTLLVPIAQRHDAHYRKLLWSEHAGLLRYVKLPLEQLVIPLKEYFYPLEEDTSLIESYMIALVRGIVRQDWCPVPWAIAVHHSAMYLKNPSKLAVRMRTQLEKISNKALVVLLLNYEPPTL